MQDQKHSQESLKQWQSNGVKTKFKTIKKTIMTTVNNELATIDQKKDLAHLNELVTEITELKEGYKDLTIEGPEDKDGYEKIRAAIGVLRPKRTGLEAERKSVVKPYNDTVKLINGEYEKITSLIQDGPGGETELKAKKEAIDEIIEKEKEEKRLEEERKINDRINELIAKGMVFDGNFYSISAPELGISETSIGVVDIRTMSDDLYKNFLQMVIDKSGKIEAYKAEKERLLQKEKEEKEAAEKKEREEFAKKKAELDEQEKKMKEQQKQMQEQQDKIDRDKKEAEQNRINGIIRHRSSVLVGMGLEYSDNGGSFDYNGETLVSDAAGIADYDDADWLNLIETLKGTIKKKKEDAEAFLAKQKKEEEEKIKQQEADRQAGLSDQQRMKEYTTALLAIQVPEFKTKKWKTVAGTIRDFITDNTPA